MSKFDDMMDYRENRERFNDLKRKLDTIVPFVGAGLSVPFGFPQWGEFLLSCCSHNSSIQNEVRNILNSGKPDCYEVAASYLSEELRKEDPDFFHQKIRETFNKEIPSCPESPVTLFSSLFKGIIITTNFDHVIEEHIEKYQTIHINQTELFIKALKGDKDSQKVVLKLHGDVDDIENIVLTKEQYDQSYLKNPNFQERFDVLLMCKTFLFLGCSLNQDRTMEFMKRAKSLEYTRYVKNYAFMASPAFRFKNIKEKTKEIQEEEILAKQEEKGIEDRLKDVNILPIWYPEKEYEWIREYLSWLQRKDYFEIFQNLLDTPLFLEDKYKEEEQITLEDIYTEPKFAFFDVKQNILRDSPESLLELIDQFIKNPSPKNIKEKYKVVNSNYIGNTLFILGEPGIGKSSLVCKIVNTISKKKVYCVRLRDLDKKEIQREGALKAILNLLSIEDINLTQKTLILDGVDELCGIENYESSIDDFCFSLIKAASRLNFKLLFTSRLNYVHLEDSRFNAILVLKLLPFQKEQFKHWFDQYYTKHNQLEQTSLIREHLFMLCNTKEEAEKKKLELLGIPLVLYLLVELQVDISEIHSLGQLYDKLFDNLEGRFYDGKTTHTLPNLYENCKEIAESIAQKMFDIQKDTLTSEQYHEVFLSLPRKLKTSFPMIVENEHFYLLSFYYRMDKEKCSVEFIHKSLMEYLVSEILYDHLSQILELSEEKQKEELQKELDRFFTFHAITDEISLFFLEKVKKNEKQQPLFSLLKKYYKFYLEVGFLYKISNNINSLTKIQNLFISYWKLLRILANTKKENLLEEEKNFFCIYLIRIPFENINLSYQNLAETKLNRADLSGADLRVADLRIANLSGTDLRGTDLRGTDLNWADLSGAKLNNAKLNWANLRGAKLNGADLSGADLRGADLRVADLKGAKLNGADLNGADLSEAYLNKADLSGANLNGAKLPASLIIK